MVQMVPDRTGRFSKRPHYQPEELDQECEQIVTQFLRSLHSEAVFPITTDDLTKLIERDAGDLDLYADLSHLGPDVEGVTEFHPGRRPVVRISAELSGDPPAGKTASAPPSPMSMDTSISTRIFGNCEIGRRISSTGEGWPSQAIVSVTP